MHNINTSDDLWPKKGEIVRYYMNDTHPFFPFEPKLTCGKEYEVVNIRFIPCGDQIEIRDDNLRFQWVFLHQFKFIDEGSVYNEEDN